MRPTAKAALSVLMLAVSAAWAAIPPLGYESSVIPAANLITVSTLTVTGQANLQGLVDLAGGSNRFVVGTSTFVIANGLVGILTASPTTPLDVNGAAQFGSGATKSTFTATGALTIASGAALTVNGSTFGVTTGGIVSAPSQPSVRAYTGGAVAIPNATNTIIYFGSEDFDNNNMHDATNSSGTFTVPAGGAGNYLVTCSGRYAANAVGVRQIFPTKGGSQANGVAAGQVIASATDQNVVSHSVLFNAAAGNVFDCRTYQDSTGNLNLNVAHMEIQKLW